MICLSEACKQQPAKPHDHVAAWDICSNAPQRQPYSPAKTPTPLNTPTIANTTMASLTTPEDPNTWTPEQLMRSHRGELKQDLFIRCAEWYTNAEVEAKINAGRTDGSKIKNPNFYAEFKRNIDNAALRDGHLPAEYRLQYDKRRLRNLEARFGAENGAVNSMRSSIRQREALGCEFFLATCHLRAALTNSWTVPTLSANPSLQELEAARPDNGRQLQKGRETRDYWFKFVAATKTHSEEQIRDAYNMANSTVHQEINRAKRIVSSLTAVEEIERSGGSVEQTYIPPPVLAPGQKIYTILPRSSLMVVLKLDRNVVKPSTSPQKKRPRTAPKSNNSPSLLSTRMKTTLSRLRYELDEDPTYPPTLAILARRFQLPIEHPDATERERAAFASCETSETLAAYAAWCDTTGAEISRRNGSARIGKCLSHVIRSWREEVREAEEAGAAVLEETFLQVVMRRLEDLKGVEREVREGERRYEEWARDVECG
jgi:hypothetical protein